MSPRCAAVLGAGGMLGRRVVEALARLTFAVTAFDHEQIDITDKRRLRSQLEQLRPQVVVNCAAYTDVDGAETDEAAAYAVNATGARHVALCCDDLDARLIQISTDYVFSGRAQTPYHELSESEPLGVYGKSKALGEWYVRHVCRRFAIVRTAWLFGPDGKNFVSSILARARTGQPLAVVDDQIGSPTLTTHLAMVIAALVENEALGIFHATSRGHCSWFELAGEVLRLTRVDVPLTAIKTAELCRPAARPAYSVLQNNHLPLEGIAPLPPWQEAVREYLRAAGELPN